jgi:3-hydroxyacyl-CoA dehydrogenase
MGEAGLAALEVGLWNLAEGRAISEHDRLVGRKLATVLCGGALSYGVRVSEQHLLDLEREAFLSLCGETKTQQRIQSLLTTGKPLRN